MPVLIDLKSRIFLTRGTPRMATATESFIVFIPASLPFRSPLPLTLVVVTVDVTVTVVVTFCCRYCYYYRHRHRFQYWFRLPVSVSDFGTRLRVPVSVLDFGCRVPVTVFSFTGFSVTCFSASCFLVPVTGSVTGPVVKVSCLLALRGMEHAGCRAIDDYSNTCDQYSGYCNYSVCNTGYCSSACDDYCTT